MIISNSCIGVKWTSPNSGRYGNVTDSNGTALFTCSSEEASETIGTWGRKYHTFRFDTNCTHNEAMEEVNRAFNINLPLEDMTHHPDRDH